MGQFELSNESYDKAFDMIEECKLHSQVKCIKKAGIKHNIGLIFQDLSNIEKAIKFYRESIEINEERKDSVLKDIDIARTLNNIGDCYLNLEEVEKALAEFAKARILIQSNKRDSNANKVGCAIFPIF